MTQLIQLTDDNVDYIRSNIEIPFTPKDRSFHTEVTIPFLNEDISIEERIEILDEYTKDFSSSEAWQRYLNPELTSDEKVVAMRTTPLTEISIVIYRLAETIDIDAGSQLIERLKGEILPECSPDWLVHIGMVSNLQAAERIIANRKRDNSISFWDRVTKNIPEVPTSEDSEAMQSIRRLIEYPIEDIQNPFEAPHYLDVNERTILSASILKLDKASQRLMANPITALPVFNELINSKAFYEDNAVELVKTEIQNLLSTEEQ